MYTEEEAKKKWCPMIRDGGAYQGMIYNGINSSENSASGYNCIASDCMMWRPVNPDPLAHRNVHPAPIEELPGFCGLALKP
jgi:hypothetical protein